MQNLLSGDIKTIKEVLSTDYEIKSELIIFTAKINTIFDNEFYYNDYQIAKYDLLNGYGCIITKNGLKEYKSLKSLCNAINKFNPKLSFNISKVIEYKENYRKEVA